MSLFARAALLTLAAAAWIADSAVAGRFEVSTPAEEARIVSEIRASHFLTQATFGPSMEEIKALAARIRDQGYKSAIGAWIDEQFEIPATKQVPTLIDMLHENGYPDFENQEPENISGRFRADAWWHNAITGDDQLRQRMAWALSQIFVVNDDTGFNTTRMEPGGLPRCAGYSHYYDVLVANAFGNYRDLLGEVTLHPIMGFFLTHLNNRKADPANGIYPDENYARECMQLFTIGLYKVKDLSGEYARDRQGNLIPTYDNTDIDTMARVFTGFTFASPGFGGTARYTAPMKLVTSMHDRERKVLLDGTVLPARNSVRRDLDAALDMLFNQNETPPFVSRRLIQRFTHSNPAPGYVRNVATWFHGGRRGSRGDLKAVVRAILLGSEATGLRIKRIRDEQQRVIAVESKGRREHQTSLREPVIRLTHLIRALKGRSYGQSGRFHLADMTGTLNQSPFKSPSVFNFYSPDHQPHGPMVGTDLVAPEFEILTSVSANKMHNLFRDAMRMRRIRPQTISGGRADIILDLDDIYAIALVDDYDRFRATGIDAVLDYLDILFCQGTLSETAQSRIASIVRRSITPSTNRARRKEAVQAIMTLVLTSSDCAIAD